MGVGPFGFGGVVIQPASGVALKMKGKLVRLFTLVLAIVVMSACSEAPQDTVSHTLEAIHPDDSCHVCGMTIARFPGPKAQAFTRHQTRPFKFCSTQDLFSWLLQPETAALVTTVYVHDMGITVWEKPTDDAFIAAERAWYVVGHNRRGAMGSSPASFSDRAAADDFVVQNGGRVVSYAEIDLELLSAYGGM